jgi:4-diphosphocytidyl-2-C-methyl-D-erythritol kinase
MAPGTSLTAERVEVLGRAKINLLLAVGPRRPDGYHEISSVMQSVDLADTLVLQPAASTAVTFRAGPGFSGELPEAPDLVARALALYGQETPGSRPVAADVTKQIPIAAGLAGGSADAAAALLGADRLSGGDTPSERLEALCRRLGADVVFTLRGGTALVGGWGNRLTSVASPHRLWWVLGIPDFPLRTEEVYRRFDELFPTPDDPPGRPNRLIRALVAGHPKEIAAELRNDLEAAAVSLVPALADLKAAMTAAGALAAVVSGSGPTIAALAREEAHAEEVAARAEGSFFRVEVVASEHLGAEVVAAEP